MPYSTRTWANATAKASAIGSARSGSVTPQNRPSGPASSRALARTAASRFRQPCARMSAASGQYQSTRTPDNVSVPTQATVDWGCSARYRPSGVVGARGSDQM